MTQRRPEKYKSKHKTQSYLHTSYSHHGGGFLSSCKEDDVLLRAIDVRILQEKKLVDSMLLKGRELDKHSNCIGQ